MCRDSSGGAETLRTCAGEGALVGLVFTFDKMVSLKSPAAVRNFKVPWTPLEGLTGLSNSPAVTGLSHQATRANSCNATLPLR